MGCCLVSHNDETDPTDLHHLDESQEQGGSYYRNKGKKHFMNRQYEEAILSYRTALVLSVKTQELDALQPVYYTNLSLAYKANKQYWDGIASIDRMLFALLNIKDDSLAKGRLIKAKCQISVVRDYCLGMTYSVASNKKYLAILSEAKEVLEIDSMKQLQGNLQTYCTNVATIETFIKGNAETIANNDALMLFMERKLRNYKHQAQQNHSVAKHWPTASKFLDELRSRTESVKRKLLNSQHEFILDPIIYNIFRSPVLVPSGISYEEDVLLQHFSKNEQSDPITRQNYSKQVQPLIVRNNSLLSYISQTSQVGIQDLAYIQD